MYPAADAAGRVCVVEKWTGGGSRPAIGEDWEEKGRRKVSLSRPAVDGLGGCDSLSQPWVGWEGKRL
jgi:hypothetical protein